MSASGAPDKRKADELNHSTEGATSQVPSPSKRQRQSSNQPQNPHFQNANQNGGRRGAKRRGNVLTAAQNQQASAPVHSTNSLNSLKDGLEWLIAAQYPNGATEYAHALQGLIFGGAAAAAGPVSQANVGGGSTQEQRSGGSPLQSLDAMIKQEQQEEPSVDHTDVPPPFRMDGTPSHPAPPLSALPPLPPPRQTQSTAVAQLNKQFPDTLPYPPMNGHVPPPEAVSTSPPQVSTWPPPLPEIRDLAYVSAPFTHASTLPSYIIFNNTNNYEALEFLGDAYLEVIVTRLVHSRFPTHSVAHKAKLREILVCNENLATYSRAYNFESRLKSSVTEEASSKAFTKILGDVFEAYIAAVIMSDPTTGFSTTEQWLSALMAPKIIEWISSIGQAGITENTKKDAKMELARLIVQGSSGAHKIDYKEERPMEHVKEHNMTKFHIGAYYTGCGYSDYLIGSGTGRSKALAGSEAAKDALERNRALIESVKAMIDEQRRLARASSKGGHHGGAARRGGAGGLPGHGGGGGGGPPVQHVHAHAHGGPQPFHPNLSMSPMMSPMHAGGFHPGGFPMPSPMQQGYGSPTPMTNGFGRGPSLPFMPPMPPMPPRFS